MSALFYRIKNTSEKEEFIKYICHEYIYFVILSVSLLTD